MKITKFEKNYEFRERSIASAYIFLWWMGTELSSCFDSFSKFECLNLKIFLR